MCLKSIIDDACRQIQDACQAGPPATITVEFIDVPIANFCGKVSLSVPLQVGNPTQMGGVTTQERPCPYSQHIYDPTSGICEGCGRRDTEARPKR